MHKYEIHPGEIYRYASELKAAVEAVCESPSFRTSAKSCQFLRYIVERTLSGNLDDLKERLIGIVLLGRDTSYDTGSDAGVRVRANDVRKRLAAYYAAGPVDLEFAFEIPAGTYIPRFYLLRALPLAQHDAESVVPAPLLRAPELSLQQLALPTLIALFICAICIRWQLAQEHPFVTFWNTVFQEHHAELYVPLPQPGAPWDEVSADRLENSAPLFNLAGQFHSRIALTRSLSSHSGANNILILIGSVSESSKDHASASPVSGASFGTDGYRLVINATPSGRRIVDRSAGSSDVDQFGRAALLTISNGAQRSIHIDGTDSEAIDSLITTLCESSAFPDELAGSFQEGTVTQIVFPLKPRENAIVFHESLPVTYTAMNSPL